MNASMHAFRIRPALLPESSSSVTLESVPTEVSHARRAHTKSRRGCDYCKLRRKKCDERKPICTLCGNKGVECVYNKNKLPRQSNRDTAVSNTPTVQLCLWPGPRAPAVLTSNTSEVAYTKYDLYLIDHFVKRAAQYFELPEMSGIYSVKALNLAKQYPYLMHAMIALAACHLQHVGIDAGCYRLPEAFHCQMATRGLRNAVVSIKGVMQSDAVLTTSMLLNSITFCAADYREDEASANGEPRWEWLRIQIGITDLLYRTKPFHPESMWLPMFISQHQLRITELPQNDLDIRLAAFCNITFNSTGQNNRYFEFWEQLAPVLTRTPGIQYIRWYINAVGGIDHLFIGLLEKRDTRALLLFAHWAGMMCCIRTWWSDRRVRTACLKVCQILNTVLVGRDRELLVRPAEACGFAL
ncbi:hypothetical protein K458DRAFT_487150 [Lentithecium fluviatile CBS 122367]|uniref:Zn(2)-C6 fungal-type domain-containing protein n=1 Tax=Lentithecium fluviatile CBS 122367 TaxID=1168545 RepID=A0A6G1J2Z6_9PLEO|nr:hypothetical protein K458DRAFT_487150 [Lentithecium fluviatile CBS 122367]